MEYCLKYGFRQFKRPTVLVLCRFQENLRTFTFRVLNYNCYLSVVCGVVNMLHFFILTRKTMRESSVNIIMAAVAFHDICSFFRDFGQFFIRLHNLFGSCIFSDTYGFVLIEGLLVTLTDFSRRCSTWLCFFIALIRALVLRNPASPFYQNLTNPKSAYLLILGVFLASLPLLILKLFEVEIEYFETPSYCNQNITTEHYFSHISDFFAANNRFILNSFYAVDATVSNLIPCLLFPIVTFLLINELRKADRNRRTMFSFCKSADSRRTAQLVFYFTLTYSVVQLPYGLTTSVVYLFAETQAEGAEILTSFWNLFSMLFSVSTVTHFIVCLLMSSHYRVTAMSVFCCGYQCKEKVRYGNAVNDVSPTVT